MAVTVQSSPDHVLQKLVPSVRRLARVPGSIVPETEVQVCRPLPVYVVVAAETQALQSARLDCWRFIALRSAPAFWLDIYDEGSAETLEGPDVQRLLEAAARIEAAVVDGTASVLDFPLIGAGAVRVMGKPMDLFWEYAPAIGERPVSAEDLMQGWRDRQRKIAAGSTMSIE